MNRPELSAAFRWSHEPWGAALRSARLEPHAQHLFTTRQLQLRDSTDLRAWHAIAASIGTGADQIFRVRQVHGHTVRVVRRDAAAAAPESPPPEADAIIADAPGVVVAIQVADCVPMLIADVEQRVVGAVHAGWRGTCAGIGAATVGAFAREFGCRAENLHVALGPSIGACCYEVGDELLHAFRASGSGDGELARWFTRAADGSLRLDLWAVNRDQLIAAGVRPDRIDVARLCTQTHIDLFESYRVDGPRAGRMVAAIRVPSVQEFKTSRVQR